MAQNTHFSTLARVFNGITLPEECWISGYAAIINKLQLAIPFPSKIVVVNTKSTAQETETFSMLPNAYQVEDTINIDEIQALYHHLVFALKYEGINLLVFRKIANHYSLQQLATLVTLEPSGQYSRRIWFLLEWILETELPNVPNLTRKTYVAVVDTKLQFAVEGVKSQRHLVINNLPGTVNFCPLIHKTKKLTDYIEKNITAQNNNFLSKIQKEVIQRASAFLLLKDSKASFTIEGESPKSKRAARWGQAIGQAGAKKLSHEELERLQQIVIENPRLMKMGYRDEGGFIGERDRDTFSPLPDHISAKQDDIATLMNGWLQTSELLINSDYDAVLAATSLAFGFVFIHPFVDGNGRIHRYLIHHVLAVKNSTPQGIIFPVSASILDHIQEYRKVLEAYSLPLLDFIEWKETEKHNVNVTNETIDLYRYFDATKQAEFLYDCVNDTIERIIPEEVDYLVKYDEFKTFIDNNLEMPDDMVALLVRFLEQGNGTLSKRAKEKEFEVLTAEEINTIEEQYKLIFLS